MHDLFREGSNFSGSGKKETLASDAKIIESDICSKVEKNKTSIQWTPGSQIDRSNQKIIFSKK